MAFRRSWCPAGEQGTARRLRRHAAPPGQHRPATSAALLPVLDARLVLYKTYLKLDNEVKAAVRVDAVCQRLMTVPGVGAVTALTFRAAVDDPNRSTSSRTVAAHFSLTPRRFQSGETDNPGRISRSGDPEVRSALYVAAHALVTRSKAWCSLTFAPDKASDPLVQRWWARMLRLGSSPRCMHAVLRTLALNDVRALLPQVRVPTLVMHRTGDRAVRVGAGRHVADGISGAQWLELPGNAHWWWLGETAPIIGAIKAFAQRLADSGR